MKNTKQVSAYLAGDELEGDVSAVIEMLLQMSAGLSEAKLVYEWGGDFRLVGNRPMTDAEIASATKRAAKSKAAAATKAENKLQEKKDLLEQLKRELGVS